MKMLTIHAECGQCRPRDSRVVDFKLICLERRTQRLGAEERNFNNIFPFVHFETKHYLMAVARYMEKYPDYWLALFGKRLKAIIMNLEHYNLVIKPIIVNIENHCQLY